MEIDDAPEEPAPPLGPGPKLGTVVAMVDFRPPAETGQQLYYQDANARMEAQRRRPGHRAAHPRDVHGVPASMGRGGGAAARQRLAGAAHGPRARSGRRRSASATSTSSTRASGTKASSAPSRPRRPTLTPLYASWSVGLTASTAGSSRAAVRTGARPWRRGACSSAIGARRSAGDRAGAPGRQHLGDGARHGRGQDADDEEAKPKPPAHGGGVDICLAVIAGERFESSLEAGGVVNKGAEYRTLSRHRDLRQPAAHRAQQRRPGRSRSSRSVAARPRAGAGAGVVVAPRQARLVVGGKPTLRPPRRPRRRRPCRH